MSPFCSLHCVAVYNVFSPSAKLLRGRAHRMTSPASRWPRDGSALDLLDKRLSRPVFTLRLHRTLEAALAFPGCLFGMPAFGAPAALLIALATSGGARAAWISTALLLLAVASVWAAVLFRWTGLHRARTLYSPPTVLITPWLALGLLRADALGLAGGGAGCLYLVTWFACIAPILVIKALTGRRRPSTLERRAPTRWRARSRAPSCGCCAATPTPPSPAATSPAPYASRMGCGAAAAARPAAAAARSVRSARPLR